MKDALHAEWTKVRTLRDTRWLVAATIVLTVALGLSVAFGVSCDKAACTQDTTKLSLIGVMLGQAAVAILAVLMIGNEYSTGMIRTTFAAMPGRSMVLAAKVVTLTALVVVSGTVAVLVSLFGARFVMAGNGFTAEHGVQALSLADGPTLRAVVGSVLYLVLVGLLSLGVAAVFRDSAVAMGVVLGLLYLFPILAHVVPPGELQKRLEQIAPMTAGLGIQTTRDLPSLPIGPWEGLGVLAAWAAAALLAAVPLLWTRDA
ncbi:ABC transporter permease subunit [Actinomadura vinacea]|uniref:ABC transporter permease subunit n=1 Tax=Actinomadura vinacea TaxID=115336 RepID=A0ABP5XAI2_9ACTN